MYAVYTNSKEATAEPQPVHDIAQQFVCQVNRLHRIVGSQPDVWKDDIAYVLTYVTEQQETTTYINVERTFIYHFLTTFRDNKTFVIVRR